MSDRSNTRAPVLFIPHGGGPMPLLGDPSHQPLVEFLRHIPERYTTPKAILVVSAHWEAEQPTLLADPRPELYYDYYGFPPESYQLSYPAENPGPLRDQVRLALTEAGVSVALDDQRGYDHGVFVPLKIMHPDATIPVLQLSLVQGLDPRRHIELGRALAGLREQGIMILGSGLSFHNMQVIAQRQTGAGPESEAFHGWLSEALSDPSLSTEERDSRLSRWTQGPHARYCHPREEHLLPLHVCFGAAGGETAEIVFDQPLFGQRTIGALWS